MSAEYLDEIEQIREKIYEAPDRGSESRLFDQAIRLADAHGDKALGFELRTESFDTFNRAGRDDALIVHFSWCIARSDEDPEQFPIESLLWTYKWVIQNGQLFPTVSRERIDAMCNDFARRMAARGEGARTVSYMRMGVATDLHRFDEALAELDKWTTIDRDQWSDCIACEENRRVELMSRLHRDEEAFAAAAPILKGKLTCAEIPWLTYATLLLPALRLERYEQAGEMYQKSIRTLMRMEDTLGSLGEVMTFLALTHNIVPAVRLLEERLAVAQTSPRILDRMKFYLAGEILMRRLGADPIRLRLPPAFPIHADDDTYAPETLREWFQSQALDLIEKFDTRNGTPYFAGLRKELIDRLETTPAVKLPVLGRRGKTESA
jgi:tetratricopeptide (TPR) repeat protein